MDTSPGFDRVALRDALLARYRWLALDELGPRAVDAGECDSCGEEPRLVGTCGPRGSRQLGRRCALEAGHEGWCAGHVEDATIALAWLEDLPREADSVARLWWVATGEIGMDVLVTQGEIAETLALTLAPGDGEL